MIAVGYETRHFERQAREHQLDSQLRINQSGLGYGAAIVDFYRYFDVAESSRPPAVALLNQDTVQTCLPALRTMG